MARRALTALSIAQRPSLALFDNTATTPCRPPRTKPPEQKRSLCEGPLSELMVPRKEPRDEAPALEVGLLFEVFAVRPRRGRQTGPAVPGIRVCPVIPSAAGNWTKSSVNWGSIRYLGYGRTKTAKTEEKLGLLKEFVALSQLGETGYTSSYRNLEIWLDDITTRRVWDLLRQARHAQIPFVGPGRTAVVLASSPADVNLDLTRAGSDLLIEPTVEQDGQRVPLASAILLGRPAHGIGWWSSEGPGSARSGALGRSDAQLHLAPFSTPVDDAMRSFLGLGPLRVPGRDENRFFWEFLPALRRKVCVRSSDESVELPAEAPITLLLQVTHGDGHHLDLSWALRFARDRGLSQRWASGRPWSR